MRARRSRNQSPEESCGLCASLLDLHGRTALGHPGQGMQSTVPVDDQRLDPDGKDIGMSRGPRT